MSYQLLLTIDVEGWFQVENFKQWTSFSSWSSHGYHHNLCTQCSTEELRKGLKDSKKLLEDIIGSPVYGYRSPSFLIDDEILKIIKDCSYLYDSSFNSFRMNKRYGHLAISNNRKIGIAFQVSDPFYGLPISNFQFAGHVLPWGGGGYFRLIPFPVFRRGSKSILKKDKTYIFYLHPWEIDTDQPRVNKASGVYKFRHYLNLDKTECRLSKLVENFNHCRFLTCHQYLKELRGQ